MLSARAALGFFLRLLVLYGLLVAPWPGARAAWGTLYRGVANVAFGHFGDGGRVRFAPAAEDAAMDTVITMRRSHSRVVASTPHDSRVTGYLPAAQTAALILATPLGWRRRLRALAWGAVLVTGFVALRLEILLLHWFSGDCAWCLYRPGPVGAALLGWTFEIGVLSPALTFVAPLFIWVLATFRRDDLVLLARDPQVPEL